jgi:hypothetical protein
VYILMCRKSNVEPRPGLVEDFEVYAIAVADSEDKLKKFMGECDQENCEYWIDDIYVIN